MPGDIQAIIQHGSGGAGDLSSYKSFIGAKVHCNGRDGGRSTGFILEYGIRC